MEQERRAREKVHDHRGGVFEKEIIGLHVKEQEAKLLFLLLILKEQSVVALGLIFIFRVITRVLAQKFQILLQLVPLLTQLPVAQLLLLN